jgi:hypothetical protein
MREGEREGGEKGEEERGIEKEKGRREEVDSLWVQGKIDTHIFMKQVQLIASLFDFHLSSTCAQMKWSS